ncbi:MAG: hypothetical protein ACWA5X_09120 [bacterium]
MQNMKRRAQILGVTVGLLGLTSVNADTVVTVNEGGGHTSKVSIKGDWVRIGGEGRQEYMIGDLKNGVMYAVVPAEKQIMELKGNGKKTAALGMKAELKKRGDGPKIAEYSTVEYELLANGQSCGKTYISSKAGKIKDVKKLLQVMDKLNPESIMPEGMGAMMQGMMSPCAKASAETMNEAAALGMPLKTLNASGGVENEVVSINESVKLDDKLFELPEGYKRSTPESMMQDAMKQMQEAMKNIPPEQQQMMQQMMQQFGGGMPPQ